MKSWHEIPQLNSKVVFSISRFTTNIQNLTFQSPLKLAVKPIVSLVRPTNSLFVSFAPEAADYAVVANVVGHTFKMKHLAAYLLLGLAGNTSPSESDIKGVLQSVGIDADDERLEKLLSELKGKDINEVCYMMVFSDT